MLSLPSPQHNQALTEWMTFEKAYLELSQLFDSRAFRTARKNVLQPGDEVMPAFTLGVTFKRGDGGCMSRVSQTRYGARVTYVITQLFHHNFDVLKVATAASNPSSSESASSSLQVGP